jgi:hypothetical protein
MIQDMAMVATFLVDISKCRIWIANQSELSHDRVTHVNVTGAVRPESDV